MADAPTIFKRTELPQILKVSQRKADALLLSKEIASIKIGSRRLVALEAIQAYLRRCARASA